MNYLLKSKNKKKEKEINLKFMLMFTIDELLLWEPKNDFITLYNTQDNFLKQRMSSNNKKIIGFFNNHNFQYWQYIDTFIALSNKNIKKNIICPCSNLIYTAHNNGVKIYGHIKISDLKSIKQFFRKDELNRYITGDKLTSLISLCGFDGWFFDINLDNIDDKLKKNIIDFCDYTDFDILWKKYDVFSENINLLLIDPTNDFTNINIDMKSPNYLSKIENSQKEKNIKNIYLLNADYYHELDTYFNKTKFWTSINLNLETNIINLPFITYFNTGLGNNYFINGSILNNKWNNISHQDILPTWINNITRKKNSFITTDYCYDDAFIGGSSLRFDGLIKPKTYIDVNLYKTFIKLGSGTKIINIHTKKIVNFIKTSIIIHFTTNEYINLTLNDDVLYGVWTTSKFKILLKNNTIDKISIRFENINETEMPFTVLLGGLLLFMENTILPEPPQNLQIQNMITEKINILESEKYFVKDKLNFDLLWDCDNKIKFYYIFRCIVSENSNKVIFLGRTYKNIYKITDLMREPDEMYSLISIKSVGYDNTISLKESIVKI